MATKFSVFFFVAFKVQLINENGGMDDVEMVELALYYDRNVMTIFDVR